METIDKEPYTGMYEKALQSLRIRAWYNFIVNSGVDLQSVRLKPRGIEGRDTYRRWNHWKLGNGKVQEDDLDAAEKKVPESKNVYKNGPENVRLWASLSKNSDLKDEQISSINFIPPNHQEKLEESKDHLEIILKRKWMIPESLCKKYDIQVPKVNYWGMLVFSILNYRTSLIHHDGFIAFSNNYRISEFHNEIISDQKNEIVSRLNNMKFELEYYGISEDDIYKILGLCH